MKYREFPPPPILSGFVRCFWTLDIEGQTGALHKEKIVPDGCIELIFNYGDRFMWYKADGSTALQPRSFVHGQLKEYIEVAPTGRTGIIAVRFSPYGLSAFTKIPIWQFTQMYVDAVDVFGQDVRELEDKLLYAEDGATAVNNIVAFLVERMTRITENMAGIRNIVEVISSQKGNCSVAQLASLNNQSERQFERIFKNSVGLSPKLFMKITRFGHVMSGLQQSRYESLSSLAHENGYYDQAHFIRDFKAITGTSPLKYTLERHNMSDLFTVD